MLVFESPIRAEGEQALDHVATTSRVKDRIGQWRVPMEYVLRGD